MPWQRHPIRSERSRQTGPLEFGGKRGKQSGRGCVRIKKAGAIPLRAVDTGDGKSIVQRGRWANITTQLATHVPQPPPSVSTPSSPLAKCGGCSPPQRCGKWGAGRMQWGGGAIKRRKGTTPRPCNLPPFVRPVPPPRGGGGGGSHEVTPPQGGGGIAPQICTRVSQCKSASAKKFLWRIWRPVFTMLFGPSDGTPPRGGGGIARGGGGG